MSGPQNKPVRLSAHARGYFMRRGFTEAEAIRTIRSQPWSPARDNQFEAAMDLSFNAEWNGRYYATKRVRPVFVETPDEIVVVTVYTYFF